MKIPARLDVQAIVARRRIQRMTAEQMVAWLDNAGSEMSRAFASYARTRDPADLAEFDLGVAILVAMSQTLHDR